MPPATQKYNILLQHPVPGASSLALNALRKPDQTYHDAIAALCQSTNLVHGWDLDRDDIAEGSIAYHPIFGDIIYGYSWWRASTMELCDNLKAAEANPAIAAHLIHIDSCGGQAFGLHETFDLIRSLKKPCYAVVESCAASAAYYIAAGCDKIFTTSKFSKVGSIGVMVVYVDDSEYLEKEGINFIVLAKYMQIISGEMIAKYPHNIINIHHSFLPAFIGAKPYHQAFERGVKIIGATSHYVTEDLDAGPIIEQDVVRITHRDTPETLVLKGKDLEKIVLSRAVKKHIAHKVLSYNNRTFIFN